MVDQKSKPASAATAKPARGRPRKLPIAAKPSAPAPAKPAPPVLAKAEPAPETVAVPAPPAPKPVVLAAPATPAVATPAPVAAKPAPVAPKIKSAPVASAPAPKPIEAVANKVEPKAEAPAPKPVVKAAVTKLETTPAVVRSEEKTIMTDTVTKAQETAKKFTADASEKVQAFFGDASERAKASYEKGAKLTEEFTEFQKGNVEAIVESGKLAAKAAETLGQEAADYARKSFESNTAAFKTFASAKSPTELFKLQSDFVKSSFESAIAEGTKVTEAWLKLAGDVTQPLSNRFAVAVEKAKANTAF